MPLSPMDKKNIQAIIKQPVDSVTYQDFFSGRKKAKYNDVDILCYLIDDVKVRLSGEYTPKIVARILFHIGCFLYRILENDNTCVKAILEFEELYGDYQAFIKENPSKNDEEVTNHFKQISDIVDNHKPSDIDAMIEKYQQEKALAQEKEKIEAMAKRIKELERLVETDDKKIQDKSQKLTEAKKEIDDLNRKLAALEKMISSLKDTISTNEEQIKELQALKEDLENRLRLINDIYQRKCEEDKKRDESYQETIKTLEDSYHKRTLNDNLWKERYAIDNHIIRILLKKDCSLSDLRNYLSRLGYEVSNEDLNAHLHRIQRHLRLTTKGISDFSPLIGIDNAPSKGKEWTLEATNGDVIEMIITSNPLFRFNDNDKACTLMARIYDYCLKNNIHYIVNLGSFFWGKPRQKYRLEHLDKYRKLTNKAAMEYPHDDHIISFIQGGHDDEYGFLAGYSPIDKLCAHRSDFINLGYNNSALIIPGGSNQRINLFAATANITSDDINTWLNNYYNGSLARRNESFLDFIGTPGHGGINLSQNFVAIPSLKNSNVGCNAYHIKIFVEAGIHRIMLIPLIVDKDVTPTARITTHKNYVKTK